VAFQRTLRVRRIADGGDVAFAIGIARNGSPDLNFGRVRWMPGGRALAFLAADADGVHGVFVQDFAPGRDTGATRRRLTGFLPDARTESFGIAPDGSEIVISAVEQRSAVLLARGIPDLLPANRGRK
jgi:hypothetical protein